MSKKFNIAGRLVLLSCHWRLRLWRAPWFWFSFKRLRRDGVVPLGFTSLLLGCEFAVLRLDA